MNPAMVNRSKLARETGLTTSFVSRVLNGERTPSLKSVRLLARAMGITVDEFINGLPEKKETTPV